MRKTTLEMKSLQARRRNSDDLLGCPMIQEHSLLEHFYAYVPVSYTHLTLPTICSV